MPSIFLVLLFLSVLLWLPWQAQHMEANDRQKQLIADTLWVEQAIHFQLSRNEENLHTISDEIINGSLSDKKLRDRVSTLLRSNRELSRIVWLDENDRQVVSTNDTTVTLNDFSSVSRLAAADARTLKKPQYGQPATPSSVPGPMTMDYHLPLYAGNHYLGSLIATYQTSAILEEMVPWWFAQENEIVLTDSNENIIDKRMAGGAGRNVYTYSRVLDLPGTSLILRTNSVKGTPKILSNLLVISVIVLSMGLLWSLWALRRDINRRLATEEALLQQVSFRTAMENSLVTGLRARDLDGRVTYVNPAFSQMVGYSQQDLVGKMPPMPYWAPEAMSEYQQRLAQRLAGNVTPQGFETIFQRADGTRFPVLIFESPLVNENGKQTGWMGSVLDISERKAIEEINRQQHEKLQFSARMASMGEIASTLAHELNQPLAAISSYTTGALNLLNNSVAGTGGINPEILKTALEKASAQAQRAGQIIRSVHAFVKQREPSREPVTIQELLDSAMPLVELQAHQFSVVPHYRIAADLPAVLADRTLLEQVLLNLTRNAIEAMQDCAPERRVLRIVAALDSTMPVPHVTVSVIDQGHGIPQEVVERLFSPFFSTKAEGMGMGLNICRTAVEFHGGTLTHADNPGGGAVFRFSLPALLNDKTATVFAYEK
ncbi:two-component system, LuxR family, sensor histidine kinase DctS [Collimonas sp. OK307]|nr:two-component system, LuxR family, sensor histidine kinase DctS [Collimonas sp. OK307]